MDQDTGRLIALLVALIMTGILLRRRYGNVYKAMTEALERKTGLQMAAIWRGLGIATLVVWLLVYLIFGGEEEAGLDQLFRGLFQAPSGEPGPE
ncbi:MAG: hypothetical protein OEU09_17890 [Rhodospirillales bacterium]|nr:hypothetical protein [Rhodospirillales bacterium]MDH3790320.1 hypothetical protein [Rhodospirillales bacterium]MDH3913160.1 hypothetical protein [Rhodospirillales bacterium]MDH3918002.1 hypothetical protein [Rhodospirillales bacterium]MDH3966936.1 hypothetical protein [Rhodospirillales bacterium]